jgi:hypothetical protein
MIVDNLYVFRRTISPAENETPLIVDADRVLTRSIALERFQPVTGR